jgi:hypothetical protein
VAPVKKEMATEHPGTLWNQHNPCTNTNGKPTPKQVIRGLNIIIDILRFAETQADMVIGFR